MATDDLKRLVAREIASGESIAEVARRHSYTWKGMKKLVETSEVRRLIAAERQKLDDLAEQHRAQLILLGGPAVENIRAAVLDPEHPKRLDMSRFVLEKVLPTRSRLEVEAEVETIDPRGRQEVHEATIGLARLVAEIGNSEAFRGSALKSIRTGLEALGGPPLQPKPGDTKH